MAWWYCKLKKNHSADATEPLVSVAFRKIESNGDFGNESYIDIGITNLGQVRLGSIWKDGIKVGQIPLINATFQVDFSDGGWSFAGPWDTSSDTKELGYLVTKKHKLSDKFQYPPTRVVAFHLTDSARGLVVPCFEIFSRLYGLSQYVQRTLATYELDIAIDMLIVPDVEPAPPDTWQVTVDKHCVDGDAVFLAHLKHDITTKRRVKSIWSQSETGQKPSWGGEPTFPQIGPWFDGVAQIKVSGLWLDSTKRRFLALQIDGCSDPDGVEIYLDRANTNLTGLLEKIKNGETWPSRKAKPKEKKPIVITIDADPDNGHEPEVIQGDPFEKLGEPRKVTRTKRATTKNRDKVVVQSESVDQISGGEPHGSGKGVGAAAFLALETTEADVEMLNVWRALKNMAATKENDIREVAAVNTDGSLITSGPVLIPLPDRESPTARFESDVKAWLNLDCKAKKGTRGVMIVRVKTARGVGYIMEVQKRPARTEKDEPQSTGGFCGFAFRLNTNDISSSEISTLTIQTAKKKGIVSRIVADCLTHQYAFVHNCGEGGSIKQPIKNGLAKIGLIEK